MIYSFSWRKILVALLIVFQNVWLRDNRFATWLLWLPAVCSSCRLQGMFYLFLRFSKVTALFWRSPVPVQKHLCLLSPLTQFPHSNFHFQLFFLFFSYTVLRQCWHQIYLLYLYKKNLQSISEKEKNGIRVLFCYKKVLTVEKNLGEGTNWKFMFSVTQIKIPLSVQTVPKLSMFAEIF